MSLLNANSFWLTSHDRSGHFIVHAMNSLFFNMGWIMVSTTAVPTYNDQLADQFAVNMYKQSCDKQGRRPPDPQFSWVCVCTKLI